MKKSFSALCALPVLVTAAALSLSSCAETIMNATSDLVVVSPQSRLYTGKPTLEFRSSNILSATLATSSGTAPLTMTDKAVLTASQTGLNVLEITEKDSGGKTLSTVTVNYFVNDLNPAEVDLFDALSGWTAYGNLSPEIASSSLRVPATTTPAHWGSLAKNYNANTEDVVMMAVNVPSIVNNEGYVAVGFQDNATPTNWMVAQVMRTTDGLTLNIRDSGHLTPVRASALYERSSWAPVTLYFFRNVSYYHAAILSADGTVLAAAKVENYNPTFIVTMNRRCIILGPNDTAGIATRVTADNYFYYK